MSARCPFHDDADPSLSINRETGLWVCRVPSCPGHEGGDFIDFVRRVSNLDFPHAVRYAAEHAGVDVGESATARAARIARENSAIDEDALLDRYRASLTVTNGNGYAVDEPQFIDEAIVRAYHQTLVWGDGPANLDRERVNWLFNNRGITYDTILAFQIGWTGERYTIPIRDLEGRCVNMRCYKPNATERKMISFREGYGTSRLFPMTAFDERRSPSGPIYLMEGEWDCLLARQNGLNAITTTGGAGAWDGDEWNCEFGGRDVVICYDNDDAGRTGAIAVATSLYQSLEPSTIRLFDWRHIPDGSPSMGMPDGYDFTDYIVRDHCTVEVFKQNVANLAMWTWEPPPIVPLLPAPETSAVGPDNLPTNRTDVGNARRLARRHGGDVRYVSRNWYVWDGTRYALDETGEIDRRAKDTARSILAEAAQATDDETRRKLAAFSLASESASRIRAMVDLAKSELPLAVPSSMMDTNAYLLNCPNGTYDFNEGVLREHRREDLITMTTGCYYTENASAIRWHDFLRRTFDGNDDVIQFVQRAIGYSLVGVTTEQVLFFCYGTGANGKSTFLETVRDVVGDYARTADFSTFATQRGGHSGPRNDIMRLRNARLVTAIEFDAGRALDEIVIKQLTGGDTISARRLYSESEEFRPTFTPWIAGNHKPIIKGTDEAIWRRLRLIPFAVTIPHGERDPHLRQALLGESQGILSWAIAGARAWKEIGLRPPEEVLVATQSYRNEMDTVEPFLLQRTVREPRAQIKASELYAEYKRWVEESNEDAISKTAFGLRMGEKGFESRIRGGSSYRVGVRLRSGDDMLLPDDPGTNETSLTDTSGEIHDSVHEREEPFEPRAPDW